MSEERITRVVIGRNGKPRRVLPSGRTVPIEGRTDWKRVAALTERELLAAARSDPDAQPCTPRQLARFRRVPIGAELVRAIRRKTGLSQAAFAARYGLNLRTLQDWEQGRVQPDGPAQAYLRVIDREPRMVARALGARR